MATCKSCRFFVQDTRPDYQNAGNCYRYPPAVGFATTASGESVYSQERAWLYDTEWCGEWREKSPLSAQRGG